MARSQPDRIRFPKPRPKLTNRFGLVLLVVSGLYALVTHFLTYKHFAIQWGAYLALPFGVWGLCLAIQRRAYVLAPGRKELIHTKEILGFAFSKKVQSLSEFSRMRLSEDQLEIKGKSRLAYRIFMEGQCDPVLLEACYDKNDATQRLKGLAKLADLPISWPQTKDESSE